MTQTATVEKILSDRLVQIAVVRRSACGHACESCAGCGAQRQVIHARAQDPIGVRPGDRVEVFTEDRPVLAAAALVYLLPVLTFFVGYGLSAAWGAVWLRAVFTAALTAGGLLPAVALDRRRGPVRFQIRRRL